MTNLEEIQSLSASMKDNPEQYSAIDTATHRHKLEWLILDHFNMIPKHTIRDIGFDYNWYRHPDEYVLWKANDSEGRQVSFWKPPSITSSVDAALEFLNKVGFKIEKIEHGYYGWYAHIIKEDFDYTGPYSVGTYAATLPLAITRAIVETLR